MKKWLKYGIILGIIGIVAHLLINFVPLIIGGIQNSPNLTSMSNINLGYNVKQIIIYFTVGFVIGSLVGFIISKFKQEEIK